MKTKFFSAFFVFFPSIFIFYNSAGTAFAQAVEVPHKRILFVNRNDENVSIARPRVVTNAPRQYISESKAAVEPHPAKATLNFSYERQVFEYINKKRLENGLKSLVWNDDVARIARMHSENMANYKFFDHLGLDGSMVNNRADAIGLSKWRSIGENIAYNRGYANPLEFVVESWLKSSGHRDNILNSRWQESGIGIAITADGTFYFTQVFLLKK